MKVKTLTFAVGAVCLSALASAATAETFRLRIASGHASANTYVNLEFGGAVPVQTSLPEVYTSLQTGVYNGVILFPSAMVNFKLHEVSKYYTEIGFGAITWHGLTINTARFNRLPKEVQDIILEAGRDYEKQTGIVNKEAYPKQMKAFEDAGGVIRKLPDEVRQDWAKSMAPWPAQKAKELDDVSLPGSQVLELALKEAEALGYKWPVRYKVK